MQPISAARKAWNVLTQRMETVLIRKGNDVVEFPVDDLYKNTNWKLDGHVGHYAVFSALVYEEFKHPDDLPSDLYPAQILDDVLSEWQFIPVDAESMHLSRENENKRLIPGLKYNFWFSKIHNEFVIVFRGTSRKWDWWANLRWFTKHIPGIDDHYDVVRGGMSKLVDNIRAKYDENVKITVTGHSLGGGLAQQAAYSVNSIKSVYGFNSTPVTGFYEISKTDRVKNSTNLKIVRIFEHGEVLAFLRFPIRLLYKLSVKDPEIHELRFNLLTRKNLISEHSMKEFSRFLYERLTVKKSIPEPPKPELLKENA